jgi:hypothetical protein
MRDVAAGILAVLLIVVALSLATRLRRYRQSRERARDSEQALGRMIVAELPTADDLVLFSEDRARFYYGERSIDKDLITAVRVLINGAPLATVISERHARRVALLSAAAAEQGLGAPAHPPRGTGAADLIDTRPEGIARDRWDVAIETVGGTVLVECGSIRERVSQELARSVFDAVKRGIEAENS